MFLTGSSARRWSAFVLWVTMITLYKLRFLLTSRGFKHANTFISNGQLLNLVLLPYFASGRAVRSYRKDINGVCHCKAVKGHLSLNSFSTVTVNRLCWKCGSSAELFFCSSCNVIQPPDDKTNYFDILNWWVKWRYGLKIAVIVMNESFMHSRIVFSGFLVTLLSFQKVVFITYIRYLKDITLLLNSIDVTVVVTWSEIYSFTKYRSDFNVIKVVHNHKIYVTKYVGLSSVNKHFLWTPRNFRKDTWSCKDLSILTTSARNHR